jgi:transposase
MARPIGEQKLLIAERKRLIISSLQNGFTQSEVADIFRIPRNTVHTIYKSLIKK